MRKTDITSIEHHIRYVFIMKTLIFYKNLNSPAGPIQPGQLAQPRAHAWESEAEDANLPNLPGQFDLVQIRNPRTSEHLWHRASRRLMTPSAATFGGVVGGAWRPVKTQGTSTCALSRARRRASLLMRKPSSHLIRATTRSASPQTSAAT